MKNNPTYSGIGIMSGTSLDGMDIAFSTFRRINDGWDYKIKEAMTCNYSSEWQQRLSGSRNLSGYDMSILSRDWARLASHNIIEFCSDHSLKPSFIASHGHTVFHQPENKLTLQIGDGAVIAAKTGILVVCDFRSQDVELGGQGAPLVPAGDKLLFGEYKYCLNLGGFANISYDKNGIRKAFDVCACNVILNYLSQKKGLDFDKNGTVARSGLIIFDLLKKLNALDYYKQPEPKSLGIEWAEKYVFPMMHGHNIADLLRTYTEHIAIQLANITKNHGQGDILVTGGGAKNDFLLERINALSNSFCVIPDDKLIDYKEALIFAFLGLQRIQGNINVLASVTGAKYDHSSGCLYQSSC